MDKENIEVNTTNYDVLKLTGECNSCLKLMGETAHVAPALTGSLEATYGRSRMHITPRDDKH